MARKTIFVKHVEQDSTQTAPTHHSAKRVIQESIKRKKEKQRVFPVCLASTSALIELTARNVLSQRTKTKLPSPVVNLAVQDASRR